jgi:hypothetical protein
MNQPSANSTSVILLKDPASSLRIINVSIVSRKVIAAFGGPVAGVFHLRFPYLC